MLTLAPRLAPSIEEIVQLSGELPSSARVLPKLQNLLRDPRTSTADVLDLLRLDPTLTARTVGMANRAFFGGGRTCTTLDEAVQRLGFTEVYRIVATVAAQSVFRQEMPLYGFAEGDLMEESLSAAILMPLLNTVVDVPMSGDQLYTIGLLHALGKLSLSHYAETAGIRKRLSGLSPRALTAAERRHFGHSYPEVGATMMAAWGFGEPLVEAVREQVETRLAGRPEAADLLKLSIALAGYVRNPRAEIKRALSEPLVKELQIPPESVLYLVERAREIFEMFRA